MTAFLRKIENFIEEWDMLHVGDTVVMGVSGGADSVALLLVMDELRGKYSLSLKVAHVNHGLRKEAYSEAEYVRSLCVERNIPFFIKECDVNTLAKENGLGTEEMGRNIRYAFFNDILGDSAGAIAVAHNMNDKAETMLFNLARGTGAKGLASIPPKRPGLIRPLLCVTREEIEAFLKERGTAFCTDLSNFTDDYTRNRIRNNVLPILKEQVSKDAIKHMSEAADRLRELNSFAEKFAEEVMNSAIKSADNDIVVLDRKVFNSQDCYIKTVLVKKMIDRLVPNNKDITHEHLESVVSIAADVGNRLVNLPYGIIFLAQYDELIAKIQKEDTNPKQSDSVFLNVSGTTDARMLGKYSCHVSTKDKNTLISKEKYTKCFDYDKVKKAIEIRTRLTGDRLVINESGNTRRLKNYFIDMKIPEGMRDSIPLLADGSDIIWVVGYRISEAYKITDETKRVLTITYLREDE